MPTLQTQCTVTGAPGWLATRLVEVLCKGDPQVRDLPVYPHRKIRCLVMNGVPLGPLAGLPVELVEGDLRDPVSLEEVVAGMETVFHCAGVLHPQRIRDYYEINVKGTENLLTAAINAGVKRFVYVSSNSAAGINSSRQQLMKEGDTPRPYKHYGRSKLMAEELVRRAHESGKIEATILRPCWYYGPGQPQRQTTLFTMINRGSAVLFGDGTNLRSMAYIDNVVQGLLLAEAGPASGQTYWIADEYPYRTIDIYRTIADLLGVPLRVRRVPGIVSWLCEQMDGLLQDVGRYSTYIHVAGEMTKDIACSIDKAKAELGYSPRVDLEEGMRRSIEWCRAQGMSL